MLRKVSRRSDSNRASPTKANPRCSEQQWGVIMDDPKSYGPASEYDYDYWRWWHNVLGVAIVFAIVVLISWW